MRYFVEKVQNIKTAITSIHVSWPYLAGHPHFKSLTYFVNSSPHTLVLNILPYLSMMTL